MYEAECKSEEEEVSNLERIQVLGHVANLNHVTICSTVVVFAKMMKIMHH